MIVLARSWSSARPPLGAQFNVGHPIARGLTLALCMQEGSGNTLVDLVRGTVWGNSGTAVWGGTEASDEVTVYDGASTRQWTDTGLSRIMSDYVGATEGTILVRAKATGSPAADQNAFYKLPGAFVDSQGYIGISRGTVSGGADSWHFGCQDLAGTNPEQNAGIEVPVNQGIWVDLGWVVRASQFFAVKNGYPAGSFAAAGSSMTHRSGSIAIGYNSYQGVHFNGEIAFVLAWDRGLATDEIAILHESPGVIFAPPRRLRRLSVRSVSAAAFTLSADPGSYSLTGFAASLLSDRLLTAAPGAYTLTGANAGALAGRLLSGNPGSYALTGFDASLLAARLLTAEPGAYVLTGSAASLLADRLLTAAPGSYSLTGAAAELLFTSAGNFVLVADPGAYAITGAAAGLLADRMLSANPGTYAVTGAPASVLADRLLTAAPGAYALSGQAASLLAARLLSLAPGVYTLTGVAAALVASGAAPVIVAGGRSKVTHVRFHMARVTGIRFQ